MVAIIFENVACQRFEQLILMPNNYPQYFQESSINIVYASVKLICCELSSNHLVQLYLHSYQGHSHCDIQNINEQLTSIKLPLKGRVAEIFSHKVYRIEYGTESQATAALPYMHLIRWQEDNDRDSKHCYYVSVGLVQKRAVIEQETDIQQLTVVHVFYTLVECYTKSSLPDCCLLYDSCLHQPKSQTII